MVSAGGTALAQDSGEEKAPSSLPAETLEPTFLAKKDKRLLEKSASADQDAAKAKWRKSLKKRTGKFPSRVVNIYNKWTHEYLPFNAWTTGKPPKELTNEFLRCHFTNQPTQMDPRLFPVLLKAAKKFRVKRVDVVSGFRDPKYNLSLRKKGRQVARKSEHTLGHAVDFRLPGIHIDKVHEWARSLKLGGVGFYKHSRFIHVDVGIIRFWNGT